MARLFQDLAYRAEAGGHAALGALFGAMSLDRASAFGSRLARRLGRLSGAHKVADRNMQIAFPDRDASWRAGNLDAMWDNMGRTFAEIPHLKSLRCYEPESRIEVIGAERLDAVRESGKPAVFISGHFANWEVMAMAIVQRGVDCAITYRAANNPYFDEQIKTVRRAYGVDTLTPKAGPRGAKQLLEHLAAGRSVALMNDQKFNEGIEAEFFGRPAMTAPGPTRLAMRSGAPLIPMSVARTGGAHFRVTVHAPIPVAETGARNADIKATVARINRFIEDRIRETPPDWFWLHRRFPKEVYRD
jgi:KDO2-lipid IV(A) lauroyltransferase